MGGRGSSGRTSTAAANVSWRRLLRRIVWMLAAGLPLSSPGEACAASTPSRKKPNIVVILADDLGYADVGFQSCGDIPTPHVDALAAAGVRCTNGYVSCPVCSPSRAGLLTGRYQQRFGFEYNPSTPRAGLPPAETTIAELLQSAGYATGLVGKWHLGRQPEHHPLECGFDEFYGFVGGARPYFPLKPGAPKHFLIPNDPLVRGREVADDPEYLTDSFGDEAVAFIERHRGEPFFLYLSFNAVHLPLEATHRYLERFPGIEKASRRTYAAMLSAMDDAVGRVTRKLYDEGLDESTLVFFLSDNGGHPTANAARNDPLRGQKGTVYEGGIRVPFVVKWTGRLPAGTTYSQPVISLDVLPTVMSAAGLEVPADLHLDGVNLLPHLLSGREAPPHETLYWRYGNARAVRHGRWKLTVPAEGPPALYDLANDIAESQERSADLPEIVAELNRRYAAWESGMQPPAWRALFMKDAPGPGENGSRKAPAAK